MTSLSDLANTLDVAIIGAGFSGTLVATHILNQSQKPVRVGLFERDPRHFARGVAYSSLMDCHLLNVPVGNMSAFPEDPGHFLRWAKVRQDYLIDPPWVEHLDARSFLPRRVYGDYLNSILDEAEERSAPRHTLKRCIGKVKALKIQADTVYLELADESLFTAKLVVLALGNFPPGNPHPTHSEW
ncbi:MAG: FAD/NAD(P)-binding protein [Methylococcaceae bacterium]